MLLLIVFVFVFAFLTLLLGKFVHSKFFKFISIVPFLLFLFFTSFIPLLKDGTKNIFYRTEWMPSIGVSLDFKLDGLSLLFSLMITGIGTLIYIYTSSYLRGHPYLNRFYTYLGLFMGAMLGLVLSDNIITLFIFWELTSVTSYFLIGFNNEDESARKSALWAFSITGLGGFFLLASLVVIGSITGETSIHEILSHSNSIQGHEAFGLILVFFLLGAFTKSAQFPFHFWLPGAMKAPTPVSAYLHSATMVKAGIYLLARFTPILNDGDLWSKSLLLVGGVTMVYGAFHCVFRKDLKGILAYSTISALGMLVFLLGIGTELAIYASSVFIVVHALYKASLFLITGAIDHAVHNRDITILSGFGEKMPILATAGFISALSCAGIPLTFGFIGKELIYESTLEGGVTYLAIGLTVIAVVTNIFLTCSGLLAGIKPFIGELPKKFSKVGKLELGIALPPFILAVLSLVFGVFPNWINQGIINSVTRSIYGDFINLDLKIWHGVTTALLLSGLTILLGVAVYFIVRQSHNSMRFIERFEVFAPQHMIEKLIEKIRVFAYRYTGLTQNSYLRIYLIVIVLFFIGLVGYKLFADVPLQVNTEDLSAFRSYELIVFIITVIAILFTISTSSRLTAIASIGVVGYCICLIFVFYGAPDLAMTQFAIDTLTVVLFVLVLFKLPSFLKLSNRRIQARDAIVSIAFGTLISLITLQALVSPADKEISRFYAENAYTLAKGKNVVNVILVDFRGFDTLIETMVLSIAALGVFSLLKYNTKDEESSE
ncbi:hydrogen gas-evolving membrane-bound hydrogenase subunit E [Myroides guanonis]|uniref:Multisubunit sodium/proton antiporter, MrpA subunit n=1 Tax=Myroides guanonis TaxID=1150112 RepID=A0A1I3M6J8_9FLAO|nr:hydrogen gas-evolving membrane-bound hydrogenase subunit E [Myroides guanonis]SFI92664.1 multisubunit sodium/proton antiporter, MrpA subunit [Myroides guanonis]